MRKKFEMIGLGRKRKPRTNIRGKGIFDTVKKGISAIRKFKPATKLIEFVNSNPGIASKIPSSILNPAMKVA
jgi:hypothetical protein